MSSFLYLTGKHYGKVTFECSLTILEQSSTLLNLKRFKKGLFTENVFLLFKMRDRKKLTFFKKLN